MRKTHRDARDEEVELHSAFAMLSSRKCERDATQQSREFRNFTCVIVYLLTGCRRESAWRVLRESVVTFLLSVQSKINDAISGTKYSNISYFADIIIEG